MLFQSFLLKVVWPQVSQPLLTCYVPQSYNHLGELLLEFVCMWPMCFLLVSLTMETSLQMFPKTFTAKHDYFSVWVRYQVLAVFVQWILWRNKFQQFPTRSAFLLLIKQKNIRKLTRTSLSRSFSRKWRATWLGKIFRSMFSLCSLSSFISLISSFAWTRHRKSSLAVYSSCSFRKKKRGEK